MRLISRPAWAASLRQRCTSFSSSFSSGERFFSGWRSMPGTNPATSQLDWLISMTAISVLSWSKAARDRLRSFDCGMGHSIGLLDSAEGDMPSPLAPYHLLGGAGFGSPGQLLLRRGGLAGLRCVTLALLYEAGQRRPSEFLVRCLGLAACLTRK